MRSLLTFLLAAPGAILAQSPADRPAELIAILNGGGSVAQSFTPGFIAAGHDAQLRTLALRLTAQNGRALRSIRTAPAGLNRYALTVRYERADVDIVMTLDPGASGRIAGLAITGGVARSATLAATVTALRSFPGVTGLAVSRLGDGPPIPIAALAPDRPIAIGSTFKLLVLAELVRAVDAGERRWSDVVPLTDRSVPTGILQDWPAGAPLTLHSLAALMISRSDNSAADTLIALLGRDRIAAMADPIGWSRFPGNDPLLTTAQAAKLKATNNGTLADRYVRLDAAARRALLDGPVARIPLGAIDAGALAARPSHIDTVEWFATPNDIVRGLDWFRRQGTRKGSAGETALAILAVNPGLPAGEALRFAYAGHKGGSDAGVLALNYLLRTRQGTWFAVSIGWNDARGPLAEERLATLATRIVQLVDAPPTRSP